MDPFLVVCVEAHEPHEDAVVEIEGQQVRSDSPDHSRVISTGNLQSDQESHRVEQKIEQSDKAKDRPCRVAEDQKHPSDVDRKNDRREHIHDQEFDLLSRLQKLKLPATRMERIPEFTKPRAERIAVPAPALIHDARHCGRDIGEAPGIGRKANLPARAPEPQRQFEVLSRTGRHFSNLLQCRPAESPERARNADDDVQHILGTLAQSDRDHVFDALPCGHSRPAEIPHSDGTGYATHVWIDKWFDQFFNRIEVVRTICVEINDDISLAEEDAHVTGSRFTATDLVRKRHANLSLPLQLVDHLAHAVRRAIVDHDDLVDAAGLFAERAQAPAHRISFVMTRDHHADLELFEIGPFTRRKHRLLRKACSEYRESRQRISRKLQQDHKPEHGEPCLPVELAQHDDGSGSLRHHSSSFRSARTRTGSRTSYLSHASTFSTAFSRLAINRTYSVAAARSA